MKAKKVDFNALNTESFINELFILVKDVKHFFTDNEIRLVLNKLNPRQKMAKNGETTAILKRVVEQYKEYIIPQGNGTYIFSPSLQEPVMKAQKMVEDMIVEQQQNNEPSSEDEEANFKLAVLTLLLIEKYGSKTTKRVKAEVLEEALASLGENPKTFQNQVNTVFEGFGTSARILKQTDARLKGEVYVSHSVGNINMFLDLLDKKDKQELMNSVSNLPARWKIMSTPTTPSSTGCNKVLKKEDSMIPIVTEYYEDHTIEIWVVLHKDSTRAFNKEENTIGFTSCKTLRGTIMWFNKSDGMAKIKIEAIVNEKNIRKSEIPVLLRSLKASLGEGIMPQSPNFKETLELFKLKTFKPE